MIERSYTILQIEKFTMNDGTENSIHNSAGILSAKAFVSPKAFGGDVRRKEDRGGAKRTINHIDSSCFKEVFSLAIKRSNLLSRFDFSEQSKLEMVLRRVSTYPHH